jgi:hypothetical protein
MKGVLPWLICWARCAGTRGFCPAMDALVSPVHNVFFPQRTFFHSGHILRDRQPSTAACPGCWAMGTNELK